jgi:hypothetical protein
MVVSVSLVKQPGKRIANAISGSTRGQCDGKLSGGACAVAWSAPAWDIEGRTYAESGRSPATIFFLPLPPCFPSFDEQGGEAENGLEGPS